VGDVENDVEVTEESGVGCSRQVAGKRRIQESGGESGGFRETGI
jgi:hypothetical protein